MTAVRMRHVRVLRIVAERRSTYYAAGALCASTAVADALRPFFDELDREVFGVVPLNGKNEALGFHVVSVGTLTASLVHPREVFKVAMLTNASAIIVAHNHPSGDPTPSAEDRAITERLKQAGELLGIRLLDHVVLGHASYHSFVDAGEL